MLLDGSTSGLTGINGDLNQMPRNYPKGKRKSVKPPKFKKGSGDTESPNRYLLNMLLSASPYYVSGSFLAERLKMSRVGVWSRIDKLRKVGLSIEAAQNRGYRLAGEPKQLNIHLLEAWLSECFQPCKIFLKETTDSTNNQAERILANGNPGPFAVLANTQSQGKGRLGRSWHSPKGGNIYLSVAFRPDVDLIKLRSFTLWQGIKICQLLREITDNSDLSVKWPNDLLHSNLKFGGMLTEASIDCERVKTLIFGFGLNLNASCKKFPKDIIKQSTSLDSIYGERLRIHEITAKIIKTIFLAYDDCLQGRVEKDLISEWEKVDALNEKKIKISLGNERIVGKACGIDADGGLKVKLRNGREKIVRAGDVTLGK